MLEALFTNVTKKRLQSGDFNHARTAKCVTDAAYTKVLLPVPVMPPFAASVTVTIWFPAVLKVTLKTPAPPESVTVVTVAAVPHKVTEPAEVVSMLALPQLSTAEGALAQPTVLESKLLVT